MKANLQYFVTQLKATQDRGLELHADDIIAGLDLALEEGMYNGIERTLDLTRRRAAIRREEDRRFGQPHYGHTNNNAFAPK